MIFYARVVDGVVFEVLETDLDVSYLLDQEGWVDATNANPRPDQEWVYADGIFSPPPVVVPDRRPIIQVALIDIDRESVSAIRSLLLSDPSIGFGSPERLILQAKEDEALALRAELAALP